MEISARNQIRGRVKAISRQGAVMTEVEVDVEPATIVAAITTASVERLGLKAGRRGCRDRESHRGDDRKVISLGRRIRLMQERRRPRTRRQSSRESRRE